MEQLVTELLDIADVSADSRKEVTIDERAEIAHLPQEALSEIAEYTYTMESGKARSGEAGSDE